MVIYHGHGHGHGHDRDSHHHGHGHGPCRAEELTWCLRLIIAFLITKGNDQTFNQVS